LIPLKNSSLQQAYAKGSQIHKLSIRKSFVIQGLCIPLQISLDIPLLLATLHALNGCGIDIKAQIFVPVLLLLCGKNEETTAVPTCPETGKINQPGHYRIVLLCPICSQHPKHIQPTHFWLKP
jgi:hypothetical protein